MTRQILSLDWDWFTGDCSDEGGCCGWSCGWAADARNRGNTTPEDELPRNPHCRTATLLKHPFTIGTLIVAECHASIVAHLQAEDCITHLDYHSDEGPKGNFDADGKNKLRCGNWVTYAKERHPDVKVAYYFNHPPINYATHYDVVFICKSSPWTPPRYDGVLHKLIHDLSGRAGMVKWYGHRGGELRREHRCFLGQNRVALCREANRVCLL